MPVIESRKLTRSWLLGEAKKTREPAAHLLDMVTSFRAELAKDHAGLSINLWRGRLVSQQLCDYLRSERGPYTVVKFRKFVWPVHSIMLGVQAICGGAISFLNTFVTI